MKITSQKIIIIQKIESSKPNLTLKTINYNKLKNITKNNIKYKGLENCFLYNKEEDHCIYQLLIPKKVVNKNLTLLGGKKRWWICYY